MELPTSKEESLKKTRRQIRLTAMNLLARREHSVKELQDKLKLRYVVSADGGDHTQLIMLVINELKAQDLQCDERFVESFIRVRSGQGKGPLRISQELTHKGVKESLVKKGLTQCGTDWFELASSVYAKKFSCYSDEDKESKARFEKLEPKELAKRQRYLSYRGFSFEQISYALNPN